MIYKASSRYRQFFVLMWAAQESFKSRFYINDAEVLRLTDKIYVVGHKSPDTDSVTSAIAYANLKNALGMSAVAAAAGDINNETKYLLDYFHVPYPEKLTDATDKKVILVDHNEMAQAVDKLNMENIVEIIDHHKIGGLATGKPIFFMNEPVGATGGIIAKLYEQNKIPISKEMAGLMMSAILSDTVLFKSPTCTPQDKESVEKLSRIAGVDPMKFGMELLKAKSDISSKSAKDILTGDFKKFDFSGTKSGVGQIEVMDSQGPGAQEGRHPGGDEQDERCREAGHGSPHAHRCHEGGQRHCLRGQRRAARASRRPLVASSPTTPSTRRRSCPVRSRSYRPWKALSRSNPKLEGRWLWPPSLFYS